RRRARCVSTARAPRDARQSASSPRRGPSGGERLRDEGRKPMRDQFGEVTQVDGTHGRTEALVVAAADGEQSQAARAAGGDDEGHDRARGDLMRARPEDRRQALAAEAAAYGRTAGEKPV